MGLLDDLKRQADMQRTQTSLQRSMREENVLAPVNPVVYGMRGICEFRDLRYADSFIDARKKKIGERDVYDYTDFWLKWATPNTLVFTRVLPHEIAKARELLRGANFKFTEEEKKVPGGPVQRTPQLGIDDFIVPADDLTEAMVEEFAKLLLGQPNDFGRRYRTVLPRK